MKLRRNTKKAMDNIKIKTKQMSKLIIENRTLGLSDYQCLAYVQKVITQGRISNNEKQYCYLTSFLKVGGVIMVATDLNKKSDKFIIYDKQ